MKTARKLLLGASLGLGVSTMVVAPSLAVDFSTTGPIVKYCSNGTETFLCTDDLDTILTGDLSAPGGNVELYNTTDSLGLDKFATITPATLEATFSDGLTATFSSLTAQDWFGDSLDTAYGVDNFANKWFDEALDTFPSVENFAGGTLGITERSAIYDAFVAGVNIPGGVPLPGFPASTGFQRLSDPNIAYVNEKTDGGFVFGLAGHSSAASVFPEGSPFALAFAGVFTNEVVKVTYDGETQLFYTFDQPVASGQVNREDSTSHDATYEFDPTPNTQVPEPSVVLGLLALGGILAVKQKRG